MSNYLRLSVFLLFPVSLDQFSKFVFSANSICNKNIAWSISILPGAFYFLWTATIAVLIYIFFKTKNYRHRVFFVLILSGALSNIIDRIMYGCVRDFINLGFWPVFNLADVYITIGATLLLLAAVKSQCQSPNAKQSSKS